MTQFVLPTSPKRDEVITRIGRFVRGLAKDKRWTITVEPYKKRRSNAQNAFLWKTYERILNAGGEELAGWTKDDLHDFFLIHHFGSELIEGFGVRRHKPLKRSSDLTTTEFMDFIAAIQQFMAERGVYLPDPGEELDDAA